MKWKLEILLIFALIALVLVVGCINNKQRAVDIAKNLPEVEEFLEGHPNADIKVVLWIESWVERHINKLREKCGEQMEVQDYWYVVIEEGNFKVEVWLDKDSQELLCLVREEGGECLRDSECDDSDSCTVDSCSGTPKKCSNTAVVSCISNDDCCPTGCSYNDDNDCPAQDECSTDSDCDDGSASTKDECKGTPKTCYHTTITSCIDNDNYCPSNCNYNNDNDCPEVDECSTDSDCDDNDDSTWDDCTGTPKRCINTLKTCAERNGDICATDEVCPTGFIAASNTNRCCSTTCEVEDLCSTDSECDDDNPCTNDICSGTPKVCLNTVIVQCSDGDGCCPTGCTHENDSDCSVEPNCEDVADGECPEGCTTDNDADCCTDDGKCWTGSACTTCVQVELWDTKGYPYDPENLYGPFNYKVTLTSSSGNLTGIKIYNSREKWTDEAIDNGPLYPTDTSQSLTGHAARIATFGEAFASGTDGKGFAEVEFEGFVTGIPEAEIKIGNSSDIISQLDYSAFAGGLMFRDSGDMLHTIPMALKLPWYTAEGGTTFTFDTKTIWYQVIDGIYVDFRKDTNSGWLIGRFEIGSTIDLPGYGNETFTYRIIERTELEANSHKLWLLLEKGYLGSGDTIQYGNKLYFMGTAAPSTTTELSEPNTDYFVPKSIDFNINPIYESTQAYFYAVFEITSTPTKSYRVYIDTADGGNIGPYPNAQLSYPAQDVYYNNNGTNTWNLKSGTESAYLKKAYSNYGTLTELLDNDEGVKFTIPQTAKNIILYVFSGENSVMYELPLDAEGNKEIDHNVLTSTELPNLFNDSVTYWIDEQPTTISVEEKIGISVQAKFDSATSVKDLIAKIDDSEFYYLLDLGDGIPEGVFGEGDSITIPFFGVDYKVKEVDLTGTNYVILEKPA